MWTKRDLILSAFDEMGLSSAVYDIAPDQLEMARRRMDTMMASWNGEGLRLGYSIPSTPQGSDLDDLSGLPDIAVEAVYTNLAFLLGPSLGRPVSQVLASRAHVTKQNLIARQSQPPSVKMPGYMPSGAGNRSYRPYLHSPVDSVTDGSGGSIVE